jgi:hypothetical protein
MSLTRKKTAELNTSSTVKAAKRAQAASSAAAANATNAAQNAALAAQNAAGVAQTAAQNAAVIATNTAQNASGAAQTAAANLGNEVRQRVYTARTWAAPRLEGAADYTTATVAPKVSAALRTTARQVSPADTTSSKRSVVTWSVLGAAVLAAETETADETEPANEEVLADSTGSQPAPASPDDAAPESAQPTVQSPETPVNGQVTTPGW